MASPKRKLRASRKGKSGGFLYIFLTGCLAVLLVYIWWHSGQPETKSPQNQKKEIAKPVEPVQKTAQPKQRVTPLAIPELTSGKPLVTQPPITSSNLIPQDLVKTTKLTPLPEPTAIATNQLPPNIPATGFPRPVRNPFEAQLALMAQGISAGSIDGALGSQTRAAITAFQLDQKLPPTGTLDELTRSNLTLDEEPYTNYTITSEELLRLHPIPPTWLEKSQQTSLDFENILELVAEKSCSHPNLIKRLNPSVNWSNVAPGTVLTVPNAYFPDEPAKAAVIVIHLSAKTLDAYDAATNLICHFPCSIAKRVEKRPVGELKVEVIAVDPNYTFDPAVFPESPESKTITHKLILPPGPNNPVGVAWIGLDKPGYGMHGTPRPEDVGRTESHGCFRLANWNARFLVKIVSIGTPVRVLE